MLQVRKTIPEETDRLMRIYEEGRGIMRESGNLRQWTDGYPTREIVEKDVADGNSYVCVDEAETTAEVNLHYEALKSEYDLPKDSVYVYVPIIVYNKDRRLDNVPVIITLKLHEGSK